MGTNGSHHTCNPNYSRGRNQEDRGSKLVTGKQFSRPYLKIPITKKGWQSGSRGFEFKPQCCQKKSGFFFFETRSYYVAQVGLMFLPSVGITGTHHTWL
jgi:hypothetical protein